MSIRPGSLDARFRRIDKVVAQGGGLLRRQLAILEPNAVTGEQVLALIDVILEVRSKSAVDALVILGRLGIIRPVQVDDRVAVLAQNEARGVPGEIEGAGAGLARLGLPVGMDEVSLAAGLLSHFLGGAKLKTGVRGVAVHRYLPTGGGQMGGPLNNS